MVGSNPDTVYWMDIFSHTFVEKLKCLFEKTENKREKRPGLAHFFFLKKTFRGSETILGGTRSSSSLSFAKL